MIRFLLGFILTLGGVGGIEANTEVLIPLDSLGIAVLGLVLMSFGVIRINEIYGDDNTYGDYDKSKVIGQRMCEREFYE